MKCVTRWEEGSKFRLEDDGSGVTSPGSQLSPWLRQGVVTPEKQQHSGSMVNVSPGILLATPCLEPWIHKNNVHLIFFVFCFPLLATSLGRWLKGDPVLHWSRAG